LLWAQRTSVRCRGGGSEWTM